MSNPIILGKTHLYVDITFDNYEKLKEVEEEIKKEIERQNNPKAKYDDFEYAILPSKLRRKRIKHLYSTIIFACFSIESYINGYAIYHFPKSYFKNHLDKLDLKSKWLIIPQLACSIKIDKSKCCWNLLNKLVNARNILAHNPVNVATQSGSNFTT